MLRNKSFISNTKIHVGLWKDFHYLERVILCQYGTLSCQIWARAFWHMDLSVSHQQDSQFLLHLSRLLHTLCFNTHQDWVVTFFKLTPLLSH